MSRYPLSARMQQAIESLFVDPSVPLGMLGADTDPPEAIDVRTVDARIPLRDRAATLRTTLEKFVANMTAEAAEMPDEAERLRRECVGVLLALRELWLHVPEAFPERRYQ